VLPFRLIERGFLVLTLSFSCVATLHALGPESPPPQLTLLLTTLEKGAFFLLGVSLISYGIILWIPHLLESQRVLRASYDHTRGKLVRSEKDRVRMEMRFVEADRLHALGELAAGVAHDLRNPLAIIKGTADSMARAQRAPQDLDKHVEVICRNIDRAERTIAGLLDLGRPRHMSLSSIDLRTTVADVTRLVEVEKRRRGVNIEVIGDAPSVALCDRKLVGQALLNLLLNALQASQAGDRIRVRTRRYGFSGGAVAVIAVEDEGVGIDAATRSKLFTPFFTTKSDGTGLGLLSSRRVMDEMGGAVRLFPRTHRGTRALLLLPQPALAETTS